MKPEPNSQRPPNRVKLRAFLRTASVALPTTAVLSVPQVANAYTTTGSKWPATSLRIDYRYVNGGFRTGLNSYANWSNFLGATTACNMRVNQYYLSGSEPTARLKVVWAHEAGHCLGLNHVAESNRVMYSSASRAYFNGVRGLTADEINGINALY